MKKAIDFRLSIGILALACYGCALLGVKLGRDIGSADYHNQYMRLIQVELDELSEMVGSGDLNSVKAKLERVRDIAGAAGDEELFSAAISASE